MSKLAFFTVSSLREPPDSPVSLGFFERTGSTFAAANEASGCIAIIDLGDPVLGDPVPPSIFPANTNLERVVVTFSIWKDLESVFAFAYHGDHAEALGHRNEWFTIPVWPTYVAWWIDDDTNPSWQQAADRLDLLHNLGSTAEAFNLRHPFNQDGQSVRIDREIVRIKARNAS